jgi:hypothetical protein
VEKSIRIVSEFETKLLNEFMDGINEDEDGIISEDD